MMQSRPINYPKNTARTVDPKVVAPAYNAGQPDHYQQAGLSAAPIPRTKEFWVSFRSKLDGVLYEGQFTTHKLTVKDYTRIGVRKVQLNGGFHHDENSPGSGIDQQTDMLNSMIAHLETALDRAPIWYNIDTIMDGELLGHIFAQVLEFENSFFRSEGEQNSSSPGVPGDSGVQSAEPRTSGHVAPVGRGDIPPSVDP